MGILWAFFSRGEQNRTKWTPDPQSDFHYDVINLNLTSHWNHAGTTWGDHCSFAIMCPWRHSCFCATRDFPHQSCSPFLLRWMQFLNPSQHGALGSYHQPAWCIRSQLNPSGEGIFRFRIPHPFSPLERVFLDFSTAPHPPWVIKSMSLKIPSPNRPSARTKHGSGAKSKRSVSSVYPVTVAKGSLLEIKPLVWSPWFFSFTTAGLAASQGSSTGCGLNSPSRQHQGVCSFFQSSNIFEHLLYFDAILVLGTALRVPRGPSAPAYERQFCLHESWVCMHHWAGWALWMLKRGWLASGPLPGEPEVFSVTQPEHVN